ncbi:MAG TPA: hypothetical protein VF868_05905 [Bacteroidia bacterium]|jgi:hypothetical protein
MKLTNQLWEFETTTSLSAREIEKYLFNINEGEYKSGYLPLIFKGKPGCRISGSGPGFIAQFEDGHKEYLIPDVEKRTLTIRGEWWYCGVYTITQHSAGSLVKLNIYNIAKKYRWAAALMVLPDKKKHRVNFHKLIKELERVSSQYSQ